MAWSSRFVNYFSRGCAAFTGPLVRSIAALAVTLTLLLSSSFGQGKRAINIVVIPATAVVIAHFGFDHLSWRAVKNGSVPEPVALESGGMLREKEVEQLRAIITPQDQHAFYLIHGEKGVGKSTVILQAAHRSVGVDGKQHGGIIYVEVPEDAKKFGLAAMGSALAAAFRHNFTIFNLWVWLVNNIGDSTRTGTQAA
jgi:hypothetical protein